MTGFTIHKAETWDVPQIAMLMLRHRDTSGIFRTAVQLREMLNDPSWIIFVARNQAGEVIAYGTLKDKLEGAQRFATIATGAHPEKRISGAVRAVNQARYQEILKRGGDAIYGTIKAGNEKALAFWLKDGWEVLSQNDNWIQVVRRLS